MCEAKLSANSELKSHKAHFRKFLLLAMEASVALEEADAVGVAFFLEAAVAPKARAFLLIRLKDRR